MFAPLTSALTLLVTAALLSATGLLPDRFPQVFITPAQITTPAPDAQLLASPPLTTALPLTLASSKKGVGVERIVDGDTIVLTNGKYVRFIGIDTPERGQCGFYSASEYLAGLLEGKRVTLVKGARSDTDRYGRLLRYVQVGKRDINLAMIKSGYAIARYDSRDGYGSHPREQRYIKADNNSPAATNCPAR